MTWAADHLWLIVAGPALGALVNGLWPGNHRGRTVHGVLGCAAVGLSFAVAVAQHLALGAAGREVIQHSYASWISAGDLQVDFALRLDPLASVMAMMVSGVALLIHIYSLGYMAHDKAYVRFFSFLNLFTAAMLLLVMAANLPLFFVGWEGVGLCSYLLIGFWHTRETASAAGFKAFVVNRIGDFAFMLGIFWCFRVFGTLDIGQIAERIGQASPTDIRWITLLFFIGATGKSAQLPLYVWLPDAMEGPTPVSALIHAATMVTAGVYMVVRLNCLYHQPSSVALLVAWVGAATAVFAALIALAQNDIKRVLAYSTVSQLGFMFIAAGVGAYVAAIFHLVTHAFFKACLFLGAGSVIHGCRDEQDIRKMGGLRARMATTHWTFVLATLAIAGVAPLSGFFSKDEILAAAYGSHRPLAVVGLCGALLTAFYMARLAALTFWGKTRMRKDRYDGVHESPPSMTVALVALALLAAVGGALGLPALLGAPHVLGGYLGAVLPEEAAPALSQTVEGELMLGSLVIALLGIGGAVVVFVRRKGGMDDYERVLGPFTGFGIRYGMNEVYRAWVVRPASALARYASDWFDPRIIDGAVNGLAGAIGRIASGQTRLQSGRVRDYAVVVVMGVIALLIAVLVWRP